jgi:hypothetical protein
MDKRVATILSLTLIATFVPVPAHSTVKAGSACKKVGVTSTVSGQKLVCNKVGKRLVWKKTTPVVVTSEPDILLSPLYTALKVDVLKTRQNDYSWVPSPGVVSQRVTGCKVNNEFLYGKVTFTSNLKEAAFKVFNTYSIQQADLGVVFVSEGRANSCGLWQLVEPWGNPDLYLALVSTPQAADFSFYNGY